MPKCNECGKILGSIRSLFVHLTAVHRINNSYLFTCAEDSCSRVFRSKNSFRKHQQSVHNSLLHCEKSSKLELCGSSSSNVIQKDTDVIVDETESVELLKVTPLEFSSALRLCADQFVAKLYANSRLPRNLVQKIIDDLDEFFGGGFLKIIKTKVLHALSESGEPTDSASEIKSMFDELENPFGHLKTEHLRFKYFEQTGKYIPPIPYVIGQMKVSSQNPNGVRETDFSVTGQFVPLRATLKKFFELPNALSDTLAYMNSLRSDSSTIENFIQGNLWASKISVYDRHDIVLPLFISYDDVEVNNPLGPHSGKVGAVYASIACLPPECRSELKNYFLVLLFESHTRATYSNANVLKPMVEELICLEKEGLEIVSTQGSKRVFFVTGLILGDNLGMNGILDFVESFSATYFCRFCKMTKTETQSATSISKKLLRNEANYENDLSLNDASKTGIKARCILNDIPSFHVCTNYSVDEMHDLREGICHYDIIPIIHGLTTGKYKEFELESLNTRMLMFEYGPIDSSNKPTSIKNDFWKNKKLKMTAAEMLCFVKLLGLIIGDLVCLTNPFWKLYLLLRQMLDVALAKKVSKDTASHLRVLIKEHHQLYLELTGERLKPKFHIWEHSPDVLLQSGPLANLSSIRPEAKHRDLTAPASVNMSRVNICRSVAVKHQLTMSCRLLANQSIMPATVVGPNNCVDLDASLDFYGILPSEMRDRECSLANWVEYKGVTFKPNMALFIEINDLIPTFAKIKKILVLGEMSNCPVFICEYFNTLGLNDHVLAYQVQLTNEKVCVKATELVDPFPLYAHTMANGENYIVLRYSV